ncbi:MAG: ATP-binding protein [Candidatus Woesearchaeota archaeon]
MKPLEEMLDEIGPYSVIGKSWNTTRAAEVAEPYYFFGCILGMNGFSIFSSHETATEFEISIRECIMNAAEHGNHYDKNKWIHLNFYVGKKGMVAEIEDEGEGVPEKIIKTFDLNPYNEEFIYMGGDRGHGFNGLKMRLERGELSGLGIHKSTVYFMALF